MKIKMVATYLRRFYKSIAVHILDIPSRLLALLLFLPLLLLPVILPTNPEATYILGVMALASNMAVFAASWDLLVGRCGQFSLGHAVFFGIGCYTTGLLTVYYKLPMWVTIPTGVLLAVLISLPIGFPALRVKGPYLALVSMAIPLIGTGIVFATKSITGGENGLAMPLSSRFFPHLTPIHNQRIAEYYLTLLILLISVIILYKIASSKTGIVFVSILDDELASKACGINVTRYKLMAFAISALFASLAGAVYAHLLTNAGISSLSLTLSFAAVMLTVLGGIGTIYGPIVGTYIYYILDRYVLRIVIDVPDTWHVLVLIIPVILIIIIRPRGIARFATDKLEDLAEEREIEERGKHIWKKYRKKEKK